MGVASVAVLLLLVVFEKYLENILNEGGFLFVYSMGGCLQKRQTTRHKINVVVRPSLPVFCTTAVFFVDSKF